MAEITKNSFVEANKHTKVIVQRGKDVCDFEMNELQDIQRVLVYRALQKGFSGLASQEAGSNDDGYLIVGTGATNQTTVKAGWVFAEGIPINLASDATLTGFTDADVIDPRIDVVYLAVSEVEVVDPAQVPQLGETTKRLRLTPVLAIEEGTPDASPVAPAIPTNSIAEIWKGGTHYVKLAEVYRPAGSGGTIDASDVTDFRKRLAANLIDDVLHQWPDGTVTGNWVMTCGDGINTFGDFEGEDAIRQAVDFMDTYMGTKWSLTLFVKEGTYTVNDASDQILLGDYHALRIVGDTAEHTSTGAGTYLQNTGTVPTVSLGYNSSFEVENVKFRREGTTNQFHHIEASDIGAQVTARRCSFQNGSFHLHDANAPHHFSDCLMTQSSTATLYPLFTVEVLQVGFSSIVFERCQLYSYEVDTPLVWVTHNGNVVGARTIDLIRFEDCELHCAGCTGAVTASANGGVIGIDPTAITGGGGSLELTKLEIIGCKMDRPTTTQNIGLYLTQQDVTFNEVRIIDTDWDLTGNLTSVPFYIGTEVGNPNDGGNVYIENVTVAVDDAAAKPTNLSPTGIETLTDALSGMVMFFVDVLNIRGMSITYDRVDSTVGDFRAYDGDIRDLTLSGWATDSSGSYPEGRVMTDRAKFTRLDMRALSTNFSGHPSAGVVKSLGDVSLVDSFISNFRTLLSGVEAVEVGGSITNAYVENTTINLCRDGVYSATATDTFGPDLIVKDCIIQGSYRYGIRYDASSSGGNPQPGWFEISGCRIQSCNDEGIYLNADSYDISDGNSFVVRDNIVLGNNGGLVQIRVGSASVDNTQAQIVGNDCGRTGKIRVETQTNYYVMGVEVEASHDTYFWHATPSGDTPTTVQAWNTTSYVEISGGGYVDVPNCEPGDQLLIDSSWHAWQDGGSNGLFQLKAIEDYGGSPSSTAPIDGCKAWVAADPALGASFQTHPTFAGVFTIATAGTCRIICEGKVQTSGSLYVKATCSIRVTRVRNSGNVMNKLPFVRTSTPTTGQMIQNYAVFDRN